MIIFFVLTKNKGSSKLEDPCNMKYTDSFGNICTCYVDRTQVIPNFFVGSNAIDTHNQLCQDSLKLKKKQATQNPWFRLATTLVEITVTETFLLSSYHQILNLSKKNDDDQEWRVCVQRFTGSQEYQLVSQFSSKSSVCNSIFLPEDNKVLAVTVQQSATDLSSPTMSSSFTITAGKNVICSGTDANGLLHYLVKFVVMKDPSG